MASRSFAAAASRSKAGRGCGAVCGVLHAPVLRALAGASCTASLATAPGLKIEEHKLRTTGSRNRPNTQRKRNPSLLTRIEHSCSASSWRFFGPEAPCRPSQTVPRAPPSCRPGDSRLPARTTPRPPQPRRHGSAPGARASPHRPPAGMTPSPHPRGRDLPMTLPRPSSLLAPRALPLLRPTDRTVGSRARTFPVSPQSVVLSIRGLLLVLL